MKLSVPDFRGFIERRWWLLVLVVVVLSGGAVALRIPEWPPNRDLQKQASRQAEELSLRRQLEEQEAARVAHAQKESATKSEIALAKARVQNCRAIADAAQKAIHSFADKSLRWNELASPLAESEIGKRIAKQPDDIRAFLALWQPPTVIDRSVRELQAELDALLQPMSGVKAVDGHGFVPSPQLIEGIDSLRARAIKSDAHLADAILQMEALVKKVQNTPPSELSLKEAASQLRSHEAAQATAKLTKVRELKRINRHEENAAAIKQARSVEGPQDPYNDAKAAKLLAFSTQHQRDLAEAKSDKVQQAIRFFTRQGRYADLHDNREDAAMRPFSYSRLANEGTLGWQPESVEKLYYFTGYPDNTRARGERPSFRDLSQADREEFTEIHGYLRRLGYVLIELGQLEP